MQPLFFSDPRQWRKWLKKNHKTKSELLVGYYKKHTGKPGITWAESVEEALCFGWIDGLRKSLGKESYCIRFTPRKRNSAWSAVNLRLMEKLIKEKRMTKAGMDIYKVRKTNHAYYGYEQKRIVPLSKALERLFTKNKKAWKYFHAQRPSYCNTCTRWVMSARQEATREKRLAQLISFSSKEAWIPGMRWSASKNN